MGVVRFYHLTQSPVEATLARLLTRAVEAGLRVEVRGRTPERLDWLDQKLWLGDEAGFLPHGVAGGPHDALQPVLLTTSETPGADTTCLMSVDGAPVGGGEAAGLDRTFILFDGADPDALVHARGQWKALKAEGADAEYWSEESGRWERKA